MVALLLVALSLGLDSARAAAALALNTSVRRGAFRYILALGLCDGAATLLGATLGSTFINSIEPGVQIVSAALLGVLALWLIIDPADLPFRGGLVLPLALSLDNLAAGVVLVRFAPPYQVGVLCAVTSFALGAAGWWAGRALRARVSPLVTRWAGVSLIALAAWEALG
jgi:putative Mn2+ efflux pump MntP